MQGNYACEGGISNVMSFFCQVIIRRNMSMSDSRGIN